MYFVANWKMFGGLKSLNSVHNVDKFLKKFKKKKLSKDNLLPAKYINSPLIKKIKKFSSKSGCSKLS